MINKILKWIFGKLFDKEILEVEKRTDMKVLKVEKEKNALIEYWKSTYQLESKNFSQYVDYTENPVIETNDGKKISLYDRDRQQGLLKPYCWLKGKSIYLDEYEKKRIMEALESDDFVTDYQRNKILELKQKLEGKRLAIIKEVQA